MEKNKPIVIAILNQKGGVGKTTITPNLGMGFKLIGKKVLLVDSDPQGSLRDWNDASSGSLLPVVGLDRETLPVDLKAVREGYDIIIIDAAPRSDLLAVAVIKTADIILIPVSPSPYDVWATSDIVKVIKARQEIAEGKPKAYFLINGVRKNTKLSGDVLGAIKDYGFDNIKQTISYLEIFKKTPIKGETIYQSKDKSAVTAIKEFNNIINQLITDIIYES